MSNTVPNPILEAALGLMDAAVPGMFEDPQAAWRAYVSSLRYVVLARAENPSVSQLKTIQAFSSSFYECTAQNLVEVRAALRSGELRLEAMPQEIAEAHIEIFRSEGIEVHLAELNEEDRCERLQILESLPPASET